MLAWTNNERLAVVLVVWFGFNLISAFRVQGQFRRQRRNRAALIWFIVTAMFSAIPFLAYGLYHRARWIIKGDEEDSDDETAASAPRRCPHCQALLTEDDMQPPGKPKTCSRCGMALREDDVA